jgi:GMP synthase (glutamine-hydrolysing)
MTGHVLVVQHEQVEGLGSVAAALARAGISWRYVRAHAGDTVPGDVARAAGLVIMGGPMGVYDAPRYPFLRAEMRLIESALATGLPILGICLGSQLLAHVMGAEVRASGRKEIGWHEVTLTPEGTGDPLFHGLDKTFTVFQWHGDVISMPPGATLLASSPFTSIQAYRRDNAYGMLFHLEAISEIVTGMVRQWPEELAEEGLDGAAIISQAERFLPCMESAAAQVFDAFASTIKTSSGQ